MKKMILMALTGLICFSGAAAISWFALPQPEPQQDLAAEGSEEPQAQAARDPGAELVGLRNSQPASAEQLYRHAILFEKQQKGLARQREILEEKEGRLKLIQKDMENHKRELDGTYALLRERIGVGERLVEQLIAERRRLEMLKKETEANGATQPSADPAAAASAEKAAKKSPVWLGGMEQEQAADVVRNWCDNGQMDYAVAMLVKIEERNVSKILTALNDPALVAELLHKTEAARQQASRRR